MSDRRYTLLQTEDSDWYVVPVEHAEEFSEGFAFDGGEPPEGSQAVGGWPGLVTFTDPVID